MNELVLHRWRGVLHATHTRETILGLLHPPAVDFWDWQCSEASVVLNGCQSAGRAQYRYLG